MNRQIRRVGLVVLAAALVCTGCGGKAPALKRTVEVENCGLGPLSARPRTLTLACADANSLAVDLVWSTWTSSTATATGRYTWNTCVPYCAASKTWDKTQASFTLSDPVHTSKGWLFERLAVHITGKVPSGVAANETYSEAPVGS